MILDDIVEKKKIRIEEHKNKISFNEIKALAKKISQKENSFKAYEKNSFKKALQKSGLSVIGEFKKASPSKGLILEQFDVYQIEKLYRELSIDAFSILTEEDFFKGSDDNIVKINKISNTPILRKDFVVDFYQIYEAKVLGASAVLLIVAELNDDLNKFLFECKKFNLDALVEVHDEAELKIAIDCGAEIIGINNRDLKTFVTTIDTTRNLIDIVPKDKVIVSESGMHSIADLDYVKHLGVDAVLVGEMFMRNIYNEEFIEEFKKYKGR